MRLQRNGFTRSVVDEGRMKVRMMVRMIVRLIAT